MIRSTLCIGLGLLSFRTAFGDEPAAPPGNAMCPVTTEQKVDPQFSTEYEGRRVYFCCPRCRKKFLADPTAYAASLAASTSGAAQAVTPGERASGGRDPDSVAEASPTGQDHRQERGPEEGGVPLSRGQRAWRFLGRFHPAAVHLPIGLVLSAALAELLAVWTGRPFFGGAARFMIALGALSAIAAASLGWAAGAGARFPPDLAAVLTTHRWLGTGGAVCSVGAAWLSELSNRKPERQLRIIYRSVLFGTAALIGLASHFGGVLIYGPEHYAW